MSLSLRTSPALDAADSNIRLRARRGLIIYFAVLIPLSVVFETLAIRGSSWWISALMWTPAAASVVARLALHDGFGDVSFRLGGPTRLEGDWTGANFSGRHRVNCLRYRVDDGPGTVQPAPQPADGAVHREHNFPWRRVRD